MASWSSSSCINNVVCFCLLVKVVVVVEAALIEEFLKAHNAARLEVGVPPIEWDNTVAQYAQEYANTRKAECKPEHSGGPYGENLVWSSGDMSAADAVAMWVKEKAFYDYPNNRCMDGQQCLHYTQVVWLDSVHIGCAKVKCDNNAGTFIICNYDPPGNFHGLTPY